MDDDEITPVRRPANCDDNEDDVVRQSSGDSVGSWSSVSLKNGAAAAAVASFSPGVQSPVSDLSVPGSSSDGKRGASAAVDDVPVVKAGRPAVSFASSTKAPKTTLSVPSESRDAAVPVKRQSGGRKGNRRRFQAPVLVPVNDPNEHFAAAYGKLKRDYDLDSDEEEGAGKARCVDMASAAVTASGMWKFNPITMTYEMGEGGSTGWRPPAPGASSSALPNSSGVTPKSMKSWAVAELGDLDEAMAKKSTSRAAAVVLPRHIRVAKAMGFFLGETSPFFAPVTMEQLGSSVLLPQWAISLWRVVFWLAISALWMHRVLQPGMSMFSITTSLLPAQSTVCLWVSMCGLWMLRHGWSFIAREPLKRLSPIALCYQMVRFMWLCKVADASLLVLSACLVSLLFFSSLFFLHCRVYFPLILTFRCLCYVSLSRLFCRCFFRSLLVVLSCVLCPLYLQALTLSVTMVVWHAVMQALLMEPDWYISTTFARPPPLFTLSVITLYTSTGAFVVDLLLGSLPLHLPYTWMTMALTATYTLSVSVARHGRDLPTPHRLGIDWSGVLITLLSGAVSVILFFLHRLLHVTVKSRLETAQLLNQRSELEARIAAAEAEAALSDMNSGASPAAHGEDRLKRRQHAAAMLDAMDTRDAKDIFEEDD